MFDIFCMQMGGNNTDFPAHTQYVRYHDSHLETIKRCVNRAATEFIWVVSDLCDYSNFDFTWQPVPWEAEQIHCWATGSQQYGDTFLIPVSSFKGQAQHLELLEWYEYINWHLDSCVTLKNPWPTVNSVDKIETMYAWIKHTDADVVFEPNKWNTRDLYTFTQSGSVSLVPRDCKRWFSQQFYDYPYISRHITDNIQEKPLDVVYLSNGEKNAEKNWQRLLELCPRAKRIDGINGRAQAYKACAEISDTEWFICVFAKCWMLDDFDFLWQPDYLQGAKHWIFRARNPVNGLEYGHMAPIAYHKQTVLDTQEWGLDFTMSSRHDIVPITASIADFNNTPYETWRTAFRECVKLAQADDVDSRYRLKTWTTTANGDNAEWCLRGANDACEFVRTGNDHSVTFEWKWLESHFQNIYGDEYV